MLDLWPPTGQAASRSRLGEAMPSDMDLVKLVVCLLRGRRWLVAPPPLERMLPAKVGRPVAGHMFEQFWEWMLPVEVV